MVLVLLVRSTVCGEEPAHPCSHECGLLHVAYCMYRSTQEKACGGLLRKKLCKRQVSKHDGCHCPSCGQNAFQVQTPQHDRRVLYLTCMPVIQHAVLIELSWQHQGSMNLHLLGGRKHAAVRRCPFL